MPGVLASYVLKILVRKARASEAGAAVSAGGTRADSRMYNEIGIARLRISDKVLAPAPDHEIVLRHNTPSVGLSAADQIKKKEKQEKWNARAVSRIIALTVSFQNWEPSSANKRSVTRTTRLTRTPRIRHSTALHGDVP